MKENLLFLPVMELVEKLEALKEKNRDLLTVEDVQLLDECIRQLKDRKDESDFNAEFWIEFALVLLKLLTESDFFDIH
jgi:hypothetical protein